jgi:ATP-dependent RNA helicase RhlE
VLVATDIAARGIDVRDITHMVQLRPARRARKSYVHRIGRTGRNGAEGKAIAFCTGEELDKLRAIEKITRTTLLAGGGARAFRGRRAGTTSPRPQPPAAPDPARGLTAARVTGGASSRRPFLSFRAGAASLRWRSG